MAKKRIRLPGQKDLDQYGRARLLVKDRHGRPKVRMAAAVDAREIILSGSGTLNVPAELAAEEARREERASEMGQYNLKQLREFCRGLKIPYTGKPESELRRILQDRGFTPPNEEDESEAEVEVPDEDGDELPPDGA